jgi:hypothetical protein
LRNIEKIVSLKKFILWLNDNDENFTFHVQSSSDIKTRAFLKEHPNDRFFLDDKEVTLEKFNDFFDAHDVGWGSDEQPDGSFHYTMYRDDAM